MFTLRPETENILWRKIFTALIGCWLFSDCLAQPLNSSPSIAFSQVPLWDKGGTPLLTAIEGRAIGARPGQQIVLYARSGAWYVQPFVEQPFTAIQLDTSWKNITHFGTEYAALLVEPNYRPPPKTDVLPVVGNGVIVVAVVRGEARLLLPFFWLTWWFQLAGLLLCVLLAVVWYRTRMRRLAAQLNARFEERLAERTRIAQELHDTLLQGLISASMQLHVAADQVPADAPAKPLLGHVLQLMSEVVEEGRNAIRGLRVTDSDSLEQAFARLPQELGVTAPPRFRVAVGGKPRRLAPLLRDEAWRIGREALSNAFRHAEANNIEVVLDYDAHHLCIVVSDDGRGIDPQVLHAGCEGHWGLTGMRERAEGIGAQLTIRRRDVAGTEVELIIPGRLAFESPSAKHSARRFLRFRKGKTL